MSKHCHICDAVTNCTDNCTECLKEERNFKMNELINRIRTEQEMYLDYIETLSPREIICKAYEICWRDEIMCLLESTEFSDETLTVLLKTPDILGVLYNEWLKTDISVHDMLTDIVYEFARKEEIK